MYIYYKVIKDFKRFRVLLNNGTDFTKASYYLFETQALVRGGVMLSSLIERSQKLLEGSSRM